LIEKGDSKAMESALAELDPTDSKEVLWGDENHTVMSPIFKMCLDKPSCDCLEVLIRLGCDIDSPFGSERNTALHLAAARNDASLVQWIIKHGANKEKLNEAGSPASALTLRSEHFRHFKV
jgi:ankyrin repeat protein